MVYITRIEAVGALSERMKDEWNERKDESGKQEVKRNESH